jgi:tetratricopeptide (TPR) repeat protein
MAEVSTDNTGEGPRGVLHSSAEPGREDAGEASAHAWSLYGKCEYEDALDAARAGLEHYPDALDLRYAEGLILKQLGRKREAVDAFREALLRVDRTTDKTRAAMLRRLLVGHVNLLEQGGWNLEPETWVRI